MASGELIERLRLGEVDRRRAIRLCETLVTDGPVTLVCIPPFSFRHFAVVKIIVGGTFLPEGISSGGPAREICLKLHPGFLDEGESAFHDVPVKHRVKGTAPDPRAVGIDDSVPLGAIEAHPAGFWNRTVRVRSAEHGRWLAAFSHPFLEYDYVGSAAERLLPENFVPREVRDTFLKAFFYNSFCLELRGAAGILEGPGLSVIERLGGVFGVTSLFPIVDPKVGKGSLECTLVAPAMDHSHTWVIDGAVPAPLLSRENLLEWFYGR